VREYLEAHAHKNPSLADLAKLADLSADHLTRSFRQQYGMPPHAFLREVRLNRARKLLLAGKPITLVALETGHSDHAHLTRLFKRHFGNKPSEIRSRA